jgi:histone acetyltransferase (RNA polymerase elongator complex component)
VSMATNTAVTPAGRPLIIPLFIPQRGCPHQCVFCNQRAITGAAARIPTEHQIRDEVNRFMSYAGKRHSDIQISFFGGSFLGLGKSAVTGLLQAGATFVPHRGVHSLRFSTRPDTVCPEALDWIEPFPVSTVELGAQSMSDRVLESAGRGHTAADTAAAAALLKDRGYQVGLQMMVGLPADDAAGAVESARRLADLEPDFVRIYPTLVLEGSPLARLFHDGKFNPLALDDCIVLVKELYLFFKKRRIPVVRMGLQASDGLTDTGSLLAGPYHPAFGHLVHAAIVFDAVSTALRRMEKPVQPLTIVTHPHLVSRVQGLKKQNLRHLVRDFDLERVVLLQDKSQATDCLIVAGQPVMLP